MQRNLLTIIFTLFVFQVKGQEVPNLKLLLESALKKNYQLQIAEQSIESTVQDQKILKEAYLPHAELTGKYGFLANQGYISSEPTTLYLPDGPHKIPELNNGFKSHANLAQVNLEINTLVYSGGKVPALKQALNQKIQAQKTLTEKIEQQIFENVIKAYDQLALLDHVKNLLDDSQKRLNVHRATATKALEYGLITKYELQKLDVLQSKLDAKKQNYFGQRNLVIHQLALYTGFEPKILAGIHPSLAPIVTNQSINSIENAPEIRALDLAIKANSYQLKATQTWWKPKVLAFSSLGYANLFGSKIQGKTELPHNLGYNTIITNRLQLAPDFKVGIGFKWDVFDGRKGEREVQKAKIEKRINELKKLETEELLNLNLINVTTNLQNAEKEIIVQNAQIGIAESALEQATKEYKTGLIKTSDLIDAENDLFSAQMEHSQAVFNQRRAAVSQMKATSSLNLSNIINL